MARSSGAGERRNVHITSGRRLVKKALFTKELLRFRVTVYENQNWGFAIVFSEVAVIRVHFSPTWCFDRWTLESDLLEINDIFCFHLCNTCVYMPFRFTSCLGSKIVFEFMLCRTQRLKPKHGSSSAALFTPHHSTQRCHDFWGKQIQFVCILVTYGSRNIRIKVTTRNICPYRNHETSYQTWVSH